MLKGLLVMTLGYTRELPLVSATCTGVKVLKGRLVMTLGYTSELPLVTELAWRHTCSPARIWQTCRADLA